MKNSKDILHSEIANKKTPSVQYAFFDRESVIEEFRMGLRNIKDGLPVTPQTTFNLFSLTKTFTAISILQLVQKNKLSLTDSMWNFLPEWKFFSSEISIEQLLHHTSGIPNPLPLSWIHLVDEHKQFDRDEFFAKLFSKHNNINSPPGSKFSYSNFGYILLGKIIENISGVTFETYIRENIISPSGIKNNDLSFEIDPAIHAVGYHKYWSASNLLLALLINKKKYMDNPYQGWQPFKLFYINGTPYGGLIGTLNGLINYAQCLLRSGSALINDELKSLLFAENRIDGKPTGMAFSWFTGMLNNTKYVTHAGGGGGYYIELRLYTSIGKGSILMLNRTGMTDARFLDKCDTFLVR